MSTFVEYVVVFAPSDKIEVVAGRHYLIRGKCVIEVEPRERRDDR